MFLFSYKSLVDHFDPMIFIKMTTQIRLKAFNKGKSSKTIFSPNKAYINEILSYKNI